ncbi:MAG: FAD:protein FMN transferase [Dehalococcoidia bacterium]|nr:FAD:protein FMN transferase [Dehalococcoidia bacterium]
MHFEDEFFAMNTDVQAVVESETPVPWLMASVRLLFEQQEARFSRFRESSLLSRLNRGEPITDPWLREGCRLALEAHMFTGGLFNPMVLPALSEAGYSDSFTPGIRGRLRKQEVPDPRQCIAIAGDTVILRRGQLDLGGIVKGWTADLAAELLAEEVGAAFLNAGGDIRCFGSEEGDDGWHAVIESPLAGGHIWQGRIAAALATSTSMKRRWRTTTGDQAHHLIDPRTGLPADSPFTQVSVFAHSARIAECWAKAVLVGAEPALAAALAAGVNVLTLDHEGRVQFYEG